MVGQPQVVVGAEVDDCRIAADGDFRLLSRGDNSLLFKQALLTGSIELLTKLLIKLRGHYCSPQMAKIWHILLNSEPDHDKSPNRMSFLQHSSRHGGYRTNRYRVIWLSAP